MRPCTRRESTERQAAASVVAEDDEAARIRCTLGDHAIAVEHIGSTAVPGCTAKPILDIGIAVRSETAHIHLYIRPAAGWDEKFAFRDALRRDPEPAAAYAAEKSRVAELVRCSASRAR